MIQKIEIDGKQVPFKASAAIPRIYRIKFQRDIYKDLAVLEKSIGDGKEESSNLDMFSLEMFKMIRLGYTSGAILYLVVSIALSLLAVAGGFFLITKYN